MKTLLRYLPVLALAGLLVLSQSCGKINVYSVDIEETGQQVGDVMASMDESGGSGGSLAYQAPVTGRLFARYVPTRFWERDFVVPGAEAATCLATAASQFSACASNTITRTYGDCTVGGATFTGTVVLNWTGSSANCGLVAVNDTIKRAPNFTVTGRRSATLTVSKTGTNGQVITWASGTGANKVFSFTNDGIKRVFTVGDSTLFSYTNATTSAITITGTSRTNRVLSGGALRVTNNTSGVYCDYVPTAVTWSSSTCNCPISGSWAATCSDGKASSVSITGCGSATFTLGSDSQSMTFDRCYGT